MSVLSGISISLWCASYQLSTLKVQKTSCSPFAQMILTTHRTSPKTLEHLYLMSFNGCRGLDERKQSANAPHST